VKIGIIGTRGIPNNYGGFEQFAEYLSQGLVSRGCEVSVYNSHNHPYQDSTWKGINIIHKYDPEYRLGAIGQFKYDLNCIMDSRKRNFNIILQLGYTSSSIWGRLLPLRSKIITNVDGIEYSRVKYNRIVKEFLKYAEKLAVKYSDHLVADSVIIKKHFEDKYNTESTFIPYGADIFENPDVSQIEKLGLESNKYFLLVARLQADNNIETIIKGVLDSKSSSPLVIIGNYDNTFGKYLRKNYTSQKIRFSGSIFSIDLLNNLRYFSNIYFHGHSAGGTNPSLLEAMASSALICAHNNPFNKSVLNNNVFYFSNENDIAKLINSKPKKDLFSQFIDKNLLQIKGQYSKEKIINDYYSLFKNELRME